MKDLTPVFWFRFLIPVCALRALIAFGLSGHPKIKEMKERKNQQHTNQVAEPDVMATSK